MEDRIGGTISQAELITLEIKGGKGLRIKRVPGQILYDVKKGNGGRVPGAVRREIHQALNINLGTIIEDIQKSDPIGITLLSDNCWQIPPRLLHDKAPVCRVAFIGPENA